MLVVDDERLVRWSVAETLRERGYEILEAEDGDAAIRAIADRLGAPDVVLLDLRLPDCDDLRLLTIIRRLAPAAAVILMTAFGTREVRLEARHLGALSVVDKPFDLDELDRLISRALVSSPHEKLDHGEKRGHWSKEDPGPPW